MRTNILLDEEKIKEAKQLSGIRTKKELIDRALATFIKMHKRKSLLALKGKFKFASYNYKALRKNT